MNSYSRSSSDQRHSFRHGSNNHSGGRRYSSSREPSSGHSSNSYPESSSSQQDFRQPPPSKPTIDISKSKLSAEAAVFIPRSQINVTTTESFRYIPTYFLPVICSNAGHRHIVPQFAIQSYSNPSTTHSHHQIITYVNNSHVTEPKFFPQLDNNHEEHVHSLNEAESSLSEEKQIQNRIDSNEILEDNGLQEVNEKGAIAEKEQVNEHIPESDTNVTNLTSKKESRHESRGGKEQKPRTFYNNDKRRYRNVQSSDNATTSDDRTNQSKEGTEIKYNSRRSSDTFVRHQPTRNSRGEIQKSGSFRKSQRRDNDGKPSYTRETKPSAPKSDDKSDRLPSAEIKTAETPQVEIMTPVPTTRSFAQVLQSSTSSIENTTDTFQTNVVDSVPETRLNSETNTTSLESTHLDNACREADTVGSACCDTMVETGQDNSKAWKKECIRASKQPTTVSKLNFKEMPVGEDLFSAPVSFSLAHCVGADFRMGLGIATIFKTKFQRVDELKKSQTKVGGVATLQEGNRFIFYLVTKERSNIDPYLGDLQASLVTLQAECQRLGVTELAIPRLGCGLDKLLWDDVRDAIQKIFADTEIEIRVYFRPYVRPTQSSKQHEPISGQDQTSL